MKENESSFDRKQEKDVQRKFIDPEKIKFGMPQSSFFFITLIFSFLIRKS